MKVVWLIGYPLKHSLSPVIHNTAFESANIRAVYIPMEIKKRELGPTIKVLKKPYTLGFNVTIPYKEKIISYLDQLSKEAQLIGAVNTVKYSRGKLIGYNTDSMGFIYSMPKEIRRALTGKKAVIIGAGGASRAVAFALAGINMKEIIIANRTLEKAKNIVRKMSEKFPKVKFRAISLRKTAYELADTHILVNTTPVGLKPNDKNLIKSSFLHKNLFVYDLIYNLKETKLIKLAKAKGCFTMNGMEMLIRQAALSWKIWTGKNAPVKQMRKAHYDY